MTRKPPNRKQPKYTVGDWLLITKNMACKVTRVTYWSNEDIVYYSGASCFHETDVLGKFGGNNGKNM